MSDDYPIDIDAAHHQRVRGYIQANEDQAGETPGEQRLYRTVVNVYEGGGEGCPADAEIIRELYAYTDQDAALQAAERSEIQAAPTLRGLRHYSVTEDGRLRELVSIGQDPEARSLALVRAVEDIRKGILAFDCNDMGAGVLEDVGEALERLDGALASLCTWTRHEPVRPREQSPTAEQQDVRDEFLADARQDAALEEYGPPGLPDAWDRAEGDER